MSKKRLLLYACPLYLLFYMGDAMLCSYYSLYFIERGLSSFEQSILLALIPFSLFIGCTLFSALAKNSSKSLWLFRFCMLAEAALVLSYRFCDNFVALCVLTPLIGIVNGAPFALIEGYLVPMIEKHKGNYATIRLFGSAGYAVSLGLGGVLLRFMPLYDCYYFSCAFFLSALALSFLFHEPLRNRMPLVEETKIPDRPVTEKKPFLSKYAIIFCLSQMLFYGAYNACTYLFPTRLNTLGFPDADYSWTRAIGVMIEMVFLLAMPFIGKAFRGNKKVPMLLSGFFIVASTSMGSFLLEPWSLAFAFFTLNSIGKALLFAYQAPLLEDIVGEEDLGRVLTISTGGVNLIGAVLNLFSSSMTDSWGFQGYFGFIVLLEIAGVGLMFLLPRKKTEQIAAA